MVGVGEELEEEAEGRTNHLDSQQAPAYTVLFFTLGILVGCRPGGHKESDTTERLHFTSVSCTRLKDRFWSCWLQF